MGLAPFFEKNAVAAAQLLRGYDKDAFASALTQRPPEVVFGGGALASPILKLTLELLLNLLARLYPIIRLTPLDEAARSHQPRLVELVRSINPNVEFLGSSQEVLRLVVGAPSTQAVPNGPTLFIGATGWTGLLSRQRPLTSSGIANPFGAGMAACLAAANAFRHTFRDQLERAELDDEVALSCAGIVPGRNAPSVAEFNIGTTHLVGAGAVGQGALWALRHVDCSGVLEVIDPESIDPSNVQRYVLTTLRDIGKPKIEFAEAAGGLLVHRHGCSWGEFLAAGGGGNLRRVLVAVDSAEARCAVQAALPKRILNAWTQPLNLGVSRHSFDEDTACLMCLYLPKRDTKSRDERVREALQLPPQTTLEIRRLLARNEPISADFVGRVAAANGVDVGALRGFVGKTLAEFYSDAVCGSTLLRVPTGRDVQTPMAFQSALAGILLAAELVLDASGDSRPPTRSTLNLLRPVGVQETAFVDAKHHSGTCICQDLDYVEAYRRRHAAAN